MREDNRKISINDHCFWVRLRFSVTSQFINQHGKYSNENEQFATKASVTTAKAKDTS